MEHKEWLRLGQQFGGFAVAVGKPNFRAQMIGPSEPPKDLEEQAWIYYYKNYSSLPVDPMLISLIKSILIDKEGQISTKSSR